MRYRTSKFGNLEKLQNINDGKSAVFVAERTVMRRYLRY